MFKIYDGRNKFYQWDIDRKIIVEDNTIKEVHFCNRTDECSLVVETYQENGLTVANVPNILLQNNWSINVYAFDGTYTKFSEKFDVVSRTKPDDYVYTETEVKSVERAVEDAVRAIVESGELKGEDGRGIADINYNKDKGLWNVRYTDNANQYFSGIHPITGQFTYFDDNFSSYPYTNDIEKYSNYRYYNSTKKANLSGDALWMEVNATDNECVGVYNNTPIAGEFNLEFTYWPRMALGSQTPYLEVRMFNGTVTCRINRNGLTWFYATTASGIPYTPTADRLAYVFDDNKTYRIKLVVKLGKISVKIWVDGEVEPVADKTNSVEVVSENINAELLNQNHKPILVFGQITDNNKFYQCVIDNYTIYKEVAKSETNSENEKGVYILPYRPSSFTADDKAFLVEYFKYYAQNGTLMPVDIYYKQSTERYYKALFVVNNSSNNTIFRIGFWNENKDWVEHQYIFSPNVGRYTSGSIHTKPLQPLTWNWVENSYYNEQDYLYIGYSYYSQLKIVGYWDDNTENIFTYNLSAGQANVFEEECGTKYYVAEPYHENRNNTHFYFESNYEIVSDEDAADGVVMRFKSEDGNSYINNGFTVLGYYYWG